MFWFRSIFRHVVNEEFLCGSCSEEDMQVYAEKAIYDDPYSYCDTRYKIAGMLYWKPAIEFLVIMFLSELIFVLTTCYIKANGMVCRRLEGNSLIHVHAH